MKLYVITALCTFSNEREVLTMDIKPDNCSYDIELGFTSSKYLTGRNADNVIVLSEYEKNTIIAFFEGKESIEKWIKSNSPEQWKRVLNREDVKFEEMQVNLSPVNSFAKVIVDIQSNS